MFNMHKTKKAVSVLLVALFTSYYVSSYFFYHTHVYEWGIVTHSHPYSSSSHSHTANTLQLINCLANLLFIGGRVVFCLTLLSFSKKYFFPFHRGHTLHALVGGNPLRAPPVTA